MLPPERESYHFFIHKNNDGTDIQFPLHQGRTGTYVFFKLKNQVTTDLDIE